MALTRANRVDSLDFEVTESFQKREQAMERRINYLRMSGMLLLCLLDIVNYSMRGLINLKFILILGLMLTVFYSYSYWIHRLTAPSHPYSPHIKYITISFDYFFLTSIILDPTRGAYFEMAADTLSVVLIMALILLNLLSALRHSRRAIIYSTLLGCLSAFLILNHLGRDPNLLIYGPAMMGVTGLLTLTLANNLRSLFLRLRHREQLMRFLSPEIVAKMDAGDLQLDLGGELKEVTILMTDIRGFTSFSEERDPLEVVTLLNEYFTAMSSIIFEHGGIIDKFIGDAIMAVYGTPETRPDDTLRALKTAQAMLLKMDQLNQAWQARGIPPLKMGIALHTGQVLAGNIGSPRRMDYTVIGDAVNVTSRIEGMNKTFNTEILFTQATYTRIKEEIPARRVGDAPVRGRKNQIELYTLEKSEFQP